MRGISEESLIKLWYSFFVSEELVGDFEERMMRQCKELNDWKPIDENTPKDRLILVYAPGRYGLNYLITTCKWHDDAGFCVDTLRFPTHWQELPPLPKEQP